MKLSNMVKLEDTSVELSFVLPCLNEALTIEACVKECLAAIKSSGIVGEILVADNGSTDGSQEIAARAGATVVSVLERGYGNALMGGIRAARGRYILMGDSDLSYDFTQMPQFLEKLRQGCDLVMGCRMGRGGGRIMPGAMPFLHQHFGNPALSQLGRVMFQTSIIDFQCGLRAFNRARMLALDLRAPGMEFASEMIVKGVLTHLKVAQVPVTLRPDGRNRPPHLRTWRDGWRNLRFMLLYSPRWLFLYPGVAAMTLASSIFSILLFGPIRLGSVRFDTNTLMVAGVGILVGFQITLFGLISEVFSRTSGLLPPSRLTERLLGVELLEKSLVLGGVSFAIGATCLLLAISKWRVAGFADLSYSDTLRLVIPAVTGISLGVQIVFGGFVLAVLELKSNRS